MVDYPDLNQKLRNRTQHSTALPVRYSRYYVSTKKEIQTNGKQSTMVGDYKTVNATRECDRITTDARVVTVVMVMGRPPVDYPANYPPSGACAKLSGHPPHQEPACVNTSLLQALLDRSVYTFRKTREIERSRYYFHVFLR